ncbi:methionyl-tRNA formyltransferase [Cytobacillus horneckiae]|uniref:Methionyl-tRNA formyltransferase n=1 Tax=Cytobacillus horneckiae TaxID=549687 RepID=A0A2N0ZM79_9BACI|nr:methionyl-tRNA formyltransferase [Cytobacillus horneckiae]MEC1156958.1 methionyl-tRNA formyltransferase [Cytobacillus horneckiae]MED2940016.1 methionyl-tRNA formyltransferase [Cytobacillus horneckiae]PKG30609.1 methionyl-tRNA formyltransferase [Cytobacillus horneckiae]
MTKIIFMGTPDFSVPVLQKVLAEGYNIIAVVTQPDRPVGRKRIMTPPPVKVEAEKHGIPVYQPEKIRNPEELQPILDLEPDLIITAAFGQILPKKLLEAPTFGCINVHASLLPELRGGAPIHYAIIQGKKKTGITIMYMAEKLDAGDILTQVEVEIDHNDTVGSLHDKLSEAGSNLLSETLPRILNKELKSIPQDDALATFAANIKREQERINWNKSAKEIYNHIRGMNPWPVAYTTFDGSVIKIWESKQLDKSSGANPGTIIEVDNEGLTVATGDNGAIKIIALQPSGKKRMDAGQYLRGAGAHIQPGHCLGKSK